MTASYKELTLCQTSPGQQDMPFENTMGKGEISCLLVTSNFSFSHSVFYRFGEPSVIFIKFKIVVCKLFQGLFGKGIKHCVKRRKL